MLDVSATAVGMSAATEAAIAAQVGAAAAAAAPALLGAMPMGADLDSVQFAAALNAAGFAYLATAGEQVATRGLFSGAQSVAAGAYTGADVIAKAALAL